MPNTCYNFVASVPEDLVAEMDALIGKTGRKYACYQASARNFPRYCWPIPRKKREELHPIFSAKAAELRARYVEVEIPTVNCQPQLLEQLAGKPCVAAAPGMMRFFVRQSVAEMLAMVAGLKQS